MSRPAVVVEGLSKAYRISHVSQSYLTVREAITGAAASAWRRLRGSAAGGPSTETFWALKGVSFRVLPGEVVGIIGRNGAGKSTLLKVLSRVTEPTRGEVRVRGSVASLLEVGTGFHPELTGRENIFLNGSILGMKRAEIARKFDDIVAFAEIDRFLDTPVKRYSSGMYVRLAFAVAAHLDPKILIVDEVLAVGDAAFQRRCLGKMKEVVTAGDRTVLFVSHNLTAVRSLCSRALWMDGGALKLDGPVAPAIEEYLAGMLGESQSFYDLDRYERRAQAHELLRLRRLSFNGGNPVRHGEPLDIEIGYDALGDVEGVSFGVGFCSPEGGRIMTVDTDCPGPLFALKKGDSGTVELRVEEFHLQPGRYFIDVGARSGDNFALDYMQGFAQTEVLPGPDTPTSIVGRGDCGGVRVPSACRHSVESPAERLRLTVD